MFIVLEGGDGSGKTTQQKLLVAALEAQGRTVTSTREPGGSDLLGPVLRDVLLRTGGDMAPQTEALLFAADRAEHVRTIIEPALVRGEVVVCDRFVDSTLAYQGEGRGLPQKDLLDLCLFATRGRMPDLVIVCDVSPEVALSRQDKRAPADRMEKANMGAAVRSLLLKRAGADPDHYVVVDANRDLDSVHQDVLSAVLERLSA